MNFKFSFKIIKYFLVLWKLFNLVIFFKLGLRNILFIIIVKVFIVKFEYRRSGLEGDISLYNILVSFFFCIDLGMFICYFKSL